MVGCCVGVHLFTSFAGGSARAGGPAAAVKKALQLYVYIYIYIYIYMNVYIYIRMCIDRYRDIPI